MLGSFNPSQLSFLVTIQCGERKILKMHQSMVGVLCTYNIDGTWFLHPTAAVSVVDPRWEATLGFRSEHGMHWKIDDSIIGNGSNAWSNSTISKKGGDSRYGPNLEVPKFHPCPSTSTEARRVCSIVKMDQTLDKKIPDLYRFRDISFFQSKYVSVL